LDLLPFFFPNITANNIMKALSSNSIELSEKLPPVDDYWNLFQTTGWNNEYGFTKGDLDEAIIRSWYSLSAYDSGKLIGFGRVIADGIHHALIVDIIVHPSYQNRGIGSSILEGLTTRCKAHHIRDIQLFAAAGKFGFYEKHGFISRRDNAPGMQYVYPRQPAAAPPKSSFAGKV
jgi:ribosomal protein S18 acetylase RimI-like enzyme